MEKRCVLPTWALIMVIFSFVILPSLPAGAYTILTPPTGEKLLVRARRGNASLVILAVDNAERRSLKVGRVINRQGTVEPLPPAGSWQKDGSYYVHYGLSLRRGINTFVINPGDKKVIVLYRPRVTMLRSASNESGVYLFHRKEVVPAACSGCHDRKLPADSGLDMKELEKNSNFSPVCFSCHRRLVNGSKWRHGPSANLECLACHRQGEGNKKIAVPTGRVPGLCYRCHVNERKWKTKAHVHGPVGLGACTVCHDPHGARYRFELWADSRTSLCISCHTDKQKSVLKTQGFHRHGIIVGSGCEACHDPHASDYQFQLHKPINKLCAGCHLRMQGMTHGHPVGGHPLTGKPDPRHKGRELSCASCHRPHGSNYQYLLIGSPLGGNVCTKCHH
ncbi:doubled CXXCH motif [bacterium BMS3Bbin14]|nr:doubled CXXCH motif [bacterium BMS3Abin13]GBE53415.1 doubled CXXCH motif [bacterium BMS3Bbin14]